MKIALSWLQEWITLPEPPTVLAETLTMAGLEVEEISYLEQIPGNLAGVVVGLVLSCLPHPNADKLKICLVEVGTGDALQIVCGAPNVAAGQHVLVALVGSTLHPLQVAPLIIKAAKIRGVESQGMICAQDELGIGADHEGIVVLEEELPPGTPAAKALKLNQDVVFEIGVTPNRMDALSHYGVARDLAALYQRPLKKLNLAAPTAQLPMPLTVQVLAPADCPLYTGIVIKDIAPQPTPGWLRTRLEAVGQRSINLIVDVTNYVLQDLGQPLHAFDLQQLRGNKLIVGHPAKGSTLTTLDGVARKLAEDELVIADAERPLALAGILGGLEAAVTVNTTAVFIEAAYFSPPGIRKTARNHGLHTDACYRFERGTDPNGVLTALYRAAQLITSIAGGQVSEVVTVGSPHVSATPVAFDFNKARKLIGKAIATNEMREVLARLEIVPQAAPQQEKAVLLVPAYRADVVRQQDVVEEIVRIYGLNHIAEATAINTNISFAPLQPVHGFKNRLCDALAAMGLQEVVTNSLTEESLAGPTAVRLLNPLSTALAVMRQSLLPGLLEVAAYNLHRQASVLAFFEVGKIYAYTGTTYEESYRLQWLLAGEAAPLSWVQKPRPVDFFYIKGKLTSLLERLRLTDSLQAEPLPADAELAYGEVLHYGGQPLVRYGQVKPSLAQQYDLILNVFTVEFKLELLEQIVLGLTENVAEVPKYPTVQRDLSLVVPATISWQQVEQTVVATNPALIKEVVLFDVYDQLGQGVKSYTLRISLQDVHKTLADTTIESTMSKIVQRLQQALGISIRL